MLLRKHIKRHRIASVVDVRQNHKKKHNTRMQQTSIKRVQDQARLSGEADPLGIVQKIKI